MSMENPSLGNQTPEQEKFLIDEQGKKYEYEKDGVKYGGDFLPEPAQEINLDTDKPLA